jgi:hypothetical protein
VRLAVLLVAAAVLVSGCGGSDRDTQQQANRPDARPTSTTDAAPTRTAQPKPTRQEFIAQGDALCKRANVEIKALNERFNRTVRGATDPNEALSLAAPILAEGYAKQRQDVAEFREVDPPPADGDIFEKIVEALEQQVALVGRLEDAADAGDAVRFASVSRELETTRSRARGLLPGYGFRECGSGNGDAD